MTLTGFRRGPVLAALLVAACLASACGDSEGDLADTAPAEDLPLVGALAGGQQAMDGVRIYETAEDLLPNTVYVFESSSDGPGSEVEATMSDLVVVGSVPGVDGLFGAIWPVDDDETMTTVPFGEPSAMAQFVTLEVTIDETIARSPDQGPDVPAAVPVGLVIPNGYTEADVQSMFDAFGRCVLFLEVPMENPVFSFDPTLYSIVDNGSFVVVVDDQGRLSMPLMPDGPALLDPTPTLDALRAAAVQPVEVVTVRDPGLVP